MSHVSEIDHCKLDAIVRPDCIIESHEVSDASRGWRRVPVTKIWRTIRLLGRGGFGEVHLQSLESDKSAQRALKIIPTRGMSMSEADCQRELVAMIEFRKPKYKDAAVFVDFFGWFRNDDAMFLAMEYMVLGDLEQNLQQIEDSPEHLGSALSEEETQEITRQILEGLKIMHAEGFAHRDLKPQNVFVVQKQPQWWVKLGDFGLSKQRTDQTAFRTQAGTQQYMAPELYYYVPELDVETSEYTNAIDLWALGCIIHRVIMGAVPFPSLLSLRNFCRDPKRVPLNLPPEMEEAGNFVREVLQPNPKNRPLAHAALASKWLSQKTRPFISLQSMPLLESMNLSASQGNYNTESHRGLQSQFSMPGASHAPQQLQRNPVSEPSQLPSRKPVGQEAKTMSPGSNISRTIRPPPGIANERRNSNEEVRGPSPSLSVEYSTQNSELKLDQKATTKPLEGDISESDRLKARGNEAMVEYNYTQAVDFYTQALGVAAQSDRYRYLSLRAGALNALGDYTAACQDAKDAIAQEPRYAMAWNRLGLAQFSMDSISDVQASIDAYTLAKEYGGHGASQGLENARRKVKELKEREARSKSKSKSPIEVLNEDLKHNPSDYYIKPPRF